MEDNDGIEEFAIPPMSPAKRSEVSRWDQFEDVPREDAPETAFEDKEVIVFLPDGEPVLTTIKAKGEDGGSDVGLLIGVVSDYFIYFANGSGEDTKLLTNDDIMADFDPAVDTDWSIEFFVISGEFDQNIDYTNGVDRFPEAGGEQSKYRLPIIRDGNRVSSGGVYQEHAVCINGTPRKQVIKVG
jgi:hypothetical protein